VFGAIYPFLILTNVHFKSLDDSDPVNKVSPFQPYWLTPAFGTLVADIFASKFKQRENSKPNKELNLLMF